MLLFLALACTGPASETDTDGGDTDPVEVGASFTVVGFNTESGGSDYDFVVSEVVSTIRGETLWGFSEVEGASAAEQLVAAADDGDQAFAYRMGTTGYDDRLVLAWDDDVFALVELDELDDINVHGTVRAPLVGTMRHRESGVDFLFMVNHLWRTDDAARHEQAELLNAWGRDQTLPIVAVGDYNFDWDVPTDGGDHDAGYDLMTEGGVFEWVKPDPLVITECSYSYESVLDFTFVANEAKEWPSESHVFEADRYYCDAKEDQRSDHLPVFATFTLP